MADTGFEPPTTYFPSLFFMLIKAPWWAWDSSIKGFPSGLRSISPPCCSHIHGPHGPESHWRRNYKSTREISGKNSAESQEMKAFLAFPTLPSSSSPSCQIFQDILEHTSSPRPASASEICLGAACPAGFSEALSFCPLVGKYKQDVAAKNRPVHISFYLRKWKMLKRCSEVKFPWNFCSLGYLNRATPHVPTSY